MKTYEYDLGYIQAGLDVLENYLLSEEMFWPLSVKPPEGTPDYPQLTLGELILTRERLAANPTTHLQQVQSQQVISDLERIRSKWRVAWEKKAEHSFGVRLRMWSDFIEEYQNRPQENADRYSYEVRLRVMLQLLKSEGRGQKQAEVDLLSGLDGYLQTVLESGGFMWEPEIQNGFPRDVYWYLYGKLVPTIKEH